MADTGGISDYAALASTGKEAHAGTLTGSPDSNAGNFEAAGGKLGDALTGGGAGNLQGQNAYNNGLRVGATTIDALAQARQRVTDNTMGEKAANQLEDPKFQQLTGMPPEIMSYAATLARQGGGAAKVAGFLKEMQEQQMRAKLGDAMASTSDRHAAAAALDPASATPKAVGDYGSTFDPLAGNGSGQVNVSPLQTQIGQSTVGKNQAEGAAATSNAASHAVTANANGGMGGLGKAPSGMHFVENPDSNGDKTNPSNFHLENIPGIENKLEPSTSDRFHGNMVLAGSNVANEVHNIARLGFTTTLGATNIAASHGQGLIDAIKQNVGAKMSDSDQQLYNTSTQQLGRFLGTDENGGRMVPEAVGNSITKALANIPANTEAAMYGHMAAVKQAVGSANDLIQASGARPAYKQKFQQYMDSVNKDVPFSMDDAIDLSKGKVNQGIADYIKSRTTAQAPPGAAGQMPAGLKLVN